MSASSDYTRATPWATFPMKAVVGQRRMRRGNTHEPSSPPIRWATHGPIVLGHLSRDGGEAFADASRSDYHTAIRRGSALAALNLQ